MDTSTVVVSGFVQIWTIGYLLGLAYLKGGAVALRRVLPRVAILVPILIVFLIIQGVVSRAVGSLTVGLVLLPVVYIALFLVIRRYRHLRATAPDDVRAPVAFTGSVRTFAIVWIAVLIVGLIVVSFLAARAGL